MYLYLKQDFTLTHGTAMIQPSFTSSKWNMGEIFHLSFIYHICVSHKDFFEIPPCEKKVIFVTVFIIL